MPKRPQGSLPHVLIRQAWEKILEFTCLVHLQNQSEPNAQGPLSLISVSTYNSPTGCLPSSSSLELILNFTFKANKSADVTANALENP